MTEESGIPSFAFICGMKQRIEEATKRLKVFTTYELAKDVFPDLPDYTIHKIIAFASYVEAIHKVRGDNICQKKEMIDGRRKV